MGRAARHSVSGVVAVVLVAIALPALAQTGPLASLVTRAEASPDDPAAQLALAAAAAEAGLEETAVGAADRALVLAPTDRSAQEGALAVFERFGLHERAVDILRVWERARCRPGGDAKLTGEARKTWIVKTSRPEVVHCDPTLAWRQAMHLVATGNDAMAQQLLAIVVKRDPDHVEASRELAYIYLRQGDVAGIPYLESYLETNPSDVVAARKLAQLYLMEDRLDDAVAAYALAARSRPRDPVILERWAELLGWAGRPSESVPVYERLLATDPDDREIRLRTAVALANAGNAIDAAKLVEPIGSVEGTLEDPADQLALDEALRAAHSQSAWAPMAEWRLTQDNLGFEHQRFGVRAGAPLSDGLRLELAYARNLFDGPRYATPGPESARAHELIGRLSFDPRTNIGVAAWAGAWLFDAPTNSTEAVGGVRAHYGFLNPNLWVQLSAERGLHQTTIDAAVERISIWLGRIEAYAEPVDRLVVFGQGELGFLDDENRMVHGIWLVAWRVIEAPDLEIGYMGDVEAFKDVLELDGSPKPYFSPSVYQTHGSYIAFRWGILPNLSVEARDRVLWAVEDSALFHSIEGALTWDFWPKRAALALRAGRTDTLMGTTSNLFQANLFEVQVRGTF